MGYVGSDIRTPRIDALATAGTILNRYYVMAGCSPTRAMLQTGRYAARYGMQDGTIPVNKPYGVPLSEKYLPEYLKELGYRTVSWRTPSLLWPR